MVMSYKKNKIKKEKCQEQTISCKNRITLLVNYVLTCRSNSPQHYKTLFQEATFSL